MGPCADSGRPPPNLGARIPPIHSLAKSSGFNLSPRWCVAAFHLKTGCESQLFETREAKASRASQSKQALGKFREKETGLNFLSGSPGGRFRLLGGGGIWKPGSSGRLRGQACFGLKIIRKSPLRHPTTPSEQLVLGLGTSKVGQSFFWSDSPAADRKMTVSRLFALELVAELRSWFQVLTLPQLARCEVGQTAGLHCACSPLVQWGAAATHPPSGAWSSVKSYREGRAGEKFVL